MFWHDSDAGFLTLVVGLASISRLALTMGLAADYKRSEDHLERQHMKDFA